ncbi:MAG: hypothetical protein SFY32_11710 [Bacteroidota bacterium]|nr:hypothetical protein [Bacteroidota bacterium]
MELLNYYTPLKLFRGKYKINLSCIVFLMAIQKLKSNNIPTTLTNIKKLNTNDYNRLQLIAKEMTLKGYVNTSKAKGVCYTLTIKGELKLEAFESVISDNANRITNILLRK